MSEYTYHNEYTYRNEYTDHNEYTDRNEYTDLLEYYRARAVREGWGGVLRRKRTWKDRCKAFMRSFRSR